jgi:hypothetical protein
MGGVGKISPIGLAYLLFITSTEKGEGGVRADLIVFE